MPRAKIAWRDVWVGAAVTALLFEIGKFLIGLYLGKTTVASGFGAAGSLVVLLVWVYFSAQIFLLGAEFTWVYSYEYGSKRRHQGRKEDFAGIVMLKRLNSIKLKFRLEPGNAGVRQSDRYGIRPN